MSRALSALCVASILVHTASARAFHPLATEDAGTLGPARLELELALLAQDVGESSLAIQQTWSAHVGVAARLDVGASFDATGDGELSTRASAKLRLLESDAHGWALAVRFDLTPPRVLGDAALPAVGGLVVTSWESAGGALHANFGARCEGDGGQGRRCYVVSALAAVLFPAEGLTVGADVTHELSSAEDQALVGQLVVVDALGQAGSVSLGAGLAWHSEHGAGWTTTVGYTVAVGGA